MDLLHSKKGLLLLLILLILSSVSIWAVQTQRLELRKKAAIPETTLCWDRVYEAEGGPVWPDSCRGDISTDTACLQVLTPLTENELAQYQAWVLNGKPPIPGCFSPTPSCMPLPSCVNENPPCSIPNFDNYCPWPTPSPTLCTGQPDGSSCEISNCPVCNPGQPCPLMPCYLQKGLCQKGQCVVITPTPTPPPGCYYQQVQCIQAPCDPILVCPSPPPTCPSPPSCGGPIVVGDPRDGGCPRYYCQTTPTATRTPSPTPSYCQRNTPTITVVPATQSGNPGQQLSYRIELRNNDSANCPQSQFSLSVRVPPQWTYALHSTSPWISPGVTLYIGLSTLSPITYPPGNTPIAVLVDGLGVENHSQQTTFNHEINQPPTVNQMEFRIKFSGVAGGEADGAGVTARFVRNDVDVVTPPILFTHVANGVYKATVGLSGSLTIPSGPGYTIIMKGEKHVARKFCKQTGQTAPCQGNESMTISSGPSSPVFDFTGLTLDPGDLPPQDYKADSADFDIIKTLLSKPCSILTDQDKKTADLDYNGCIDIGDAFLMRKTLETRYDEN